jgi:hypothetical protein
MTRLREIAGAYALALIRADHRYWIWLSERIPELVKKWFEWLNWVLILAALQFVATKFKSVVASGVVWFSYILLLFYFHSLYITWLEEPKESPVSHIRTRSMSAWLAAFVTALFIVFLVQLLVRTIVAATGGAPRR